MDSRFALPVDTVLDGGYRIERVVGSGGFGITYAAEDIKLGTTVALKEYYPFDFGDRDRTMIVRPKSDRHKKTFEWGRSNFLQEARTLARFEHPSIVRVTRVFEANSTAYMVMRFEQGHSFEDWLKGLGRPPTQEELDRIATALLDALQMMHAENFPASRHRPRQHHRARRRQPVLLDFGAARRAVAEMSRSLTGIVKAGYSPHEQYSSDGRLQGPWSDIYALGGTLYRAVTGRTPEEATLRVDVDHMPPATQAAKGTYRPGFLSAIDACLKVRHAERPQSVAQLRPMLIEQKQQHKDSERPPLTPRGPSKPKTRWIAPGRPLASRWLAISAAAAIILGGVYGGIEYTRWQSTKPGVHEEAKQLAALIEARRNEAADAAQRQVEVEAQQRKEAAQRKAELDAERRRKEEADAARRQAKLDEDRRRQEETERIAAEKATRQAAAEADAKRRDEERRKAEEETKRQVDAAATLKKAQEEALAQAKRQQEEQSAAEKMAADDRARQDAEARRLVEAAAAKKKAEDEALTKTKADAAARGRVEEEAKHAAEAWTAIKDTTRISMLETFVARYPGTSYAGLSQGRIEKLKAVISKIDKAKNIRELEALKSTYPDQLGAIAEGTQDPIQQHFLGAHLRLTKLQQVAKSAKTEDQPDTNLKTERKRQPANLSRYSLQYWPKNSLSYTGQTVTTETPHGRLTCTSNGRDIPRSCSLR